MMTDDDLGYVSGMCGTFFGFVFDMFGIFVWTLDGHVWNIVLICLAVLRHVWDMFGICLGQISDKFGCQQKSKHKSSQNQR